MTLVAGTHLGRYRIRSKLGAGGMGEVYLAEDSELHRSVALKILPSDVSSNRDRMRRFKQEATAAFDLSRDGRQLAVSRGSQTSDEILIRDFR